MNPDAINEIGIIVGTIVGGIVTIVTAIVQARQASRKEVNRATTMTRVDKNGMTTMASAREVIVDMANRVTALEHDNQQKTILIERQATEVQRLTAITLQRDKLIRDLEVSEQTRRNLEHQLQQEKWMRQRLEEEMDRMKERIRQLEDQIAGLQYRSHREGASPTE